MVRPVAAALLALSMVGLLDSLFFALVTYRVIRPDSRLVPPFCRMDEGACLRIVDAPDARLLRVPNSVIGAAWFILVFAEAILGIPHPRVLLAGAAAALSMSLVLAYRLVFKLRTLCLLCFVAHATNALIFALALLAWAT